MNYLKFYEWKGFSCAYRGQNPENVDSPLALVLIHPIGVGLSGQFWERFGQVWQAQGHLYPIYNPDLLGCGSSEMPAVAYYPEDWAEQLKYFTENIVKKPVILIVQGALFPVALKLLSIASDQVKGLVLSGPPAWELMTTESHPTQQKLLWNLFFNSPVGIGDLFYRYARRRQFLQSFSTRQLFAETQDVDENWLEMLKQGSQNLESRYAVFSFLAGFWRENYELAIKGITQPTLVIFGDQASSISKEGKKESAEDRLQSYLTHLAKGEGKIIPGRNVLPYESTEEFVSVVSQTLQNWNL